MNKKIFTLFAGALLMLSSAFTTVSAQTSAPTSVVPFASSPYQYKYTGAGVKQNDVAFRDSLSIDTVKTYSANHFYVISVTDIANPSGTVGGIIRSYFAGGSMPLYDGTPVPTPPTYKLFNSQLALFIDGDLSNPLSAQAYLRIDTIGDLDYEYGFNYKTSAKFGAIRRASWCVENEAGDVSGSNRIWNFKNMESGKLLEVPMYDSGDPTISANWSPLSNGKGNVYSGNGGMINTYGDDLIVSGWHFSQTYASQNLQTSMPLYSYVSTDSVVVLVVDEAAYLTPGNKKGGIPVTVKQVAVNDLVKDAKGFVKTTGTSKVENVLLFTLKKINPFVLNADDYNAVSDAIEFDQDANMSKGTDGWNPFTKGADKAGNNGLGWLEAEEVTDSLYHYGYMYFKSKENVTVVNPVTGETEATKAKGYLYVDTAFWNTGNTNYLAFNFSSMKRCEPYFNPYTNEYASSTGFGWGDSFGADKPQLHSYLKTANCGNDPLPANLTAFSILSVTAGTNGDGTLSALQIQAYRADSIMHALADSLNGWIDDNSIVITFTATPAANKEPAHFADLVAVYSSLSPWASIAPGTYIGTSSAPFKTCKRFNYYETYTKYQIDSVNYLMAYLKDSIMENQSKFRVVYDPWEDNTKINVYQTRYAYPNREHASTTGAEWPNWWENSFDLSRGKRYSPSNSLMYGSPMTPVNDGNIYNLLSINNSDFTVLAGHRTSNNGTALTHGLTNPSQFSWHSFVRAWEKSSPNLMDKVMISTADTAAMSSTYSDKNLAHEYSYSVTKEVDDITKGQAYYHDSLFYVTIQDLDNGLKKIATLAQNGPEQLRKISLNYGPKCMEDGSSEKASINNNLYLIRNSLGQYLCVPIWSAMDSVYWVNPEHGEDPSRMPCYQWAVENIRGTKGSPFKLTNREFERVSIPYVYVYANKDTAFDMAGIYAPKFNTRVVYPGVSDSLTFGMKFVGTTPTYTVYQDGNDYIAWAEKQIPLSDRKSFLPLNVDVKSDQLLGYKYIDKDSTLTNVYALKYKHFMTSGGKQRYVGWNGYENTKDTTLYVNYESEFDKLYFDLNEMPFEDIKYSDTVMTTDGHIAITKDSKYFASIYNKYARKANNYINGDSLVMEKFGYMPTKKVSGELEYDLNKIPGLLPLARQAYRFLLKDYYKFSPTISGDYWTVGENDNYILADKVYATKKYTYENGNVCGVFGIPYFYLRNTFFDYQESDGDKEVHDYFALVQRLDTVNYEDNSGTSSAFSDILEYLKYRFGSTAAEKVRSEIINSRELGVFVAVVEDYTASLKMAVRGDAAIRVSTFRLDQDNDPIYRRFHGNDSWEGDGWGDAPDTLEFHRLNRGDLPLALFENSGNYLSFPGDNSLYGADGGRIYNYTDNTHKELLKDSLGNYISFLGVNNLNQYPGIQDGGVTNYSIFVDTAYINRGTGWIKPQYLLAVDPYSPEECGTCVVGDSGEGVKTEPNANYTIARYLYNTAMYAKQISDTVLDIDYNWQKQLKNYNMVKRINMSEGAYNSIVEAKDGKKYCDQNWERLAFAWAIHKGDSLYVLKGVEPAYGRNYVGDPKRLYDKLAEEYGVVDKYINFDKLIADNIVKDADYDDVYYAGYNDMHSEKRTYHTYKTMEQVKADGHTIGLQAIIDLGDNTHKDWVFSMRYVERNSDDFVIESETTNRDTQSGAVIRPGYGGWVKYQNGIPVITRSDEKELMGEGLIMNVQKIKLNNSTVPPVSNDAISSNVAVVAGTGNVTILNATGKKVVISNILGQTIANTVLSSDNASIAVPAGVVVVAVEGESAVKAVVK